MSISFPFRRIRNAKVPLEFATVEIISSGLATFLSSIEKSISFSLIPAFAAIPQATGESSSPSIVRIFFLIACSTVGISFVSISVATFELIASGFTQTKNITEKIVAASTRFMKTPARITAHFFQSGLATRESFSINPSLVSSHFSRTNPPKGIQFRVYFVPDLSVKSVMAFGGIPIPNSYTFTPESFAVIKCPSS